jgi:hypothetical protein
MSSGLLSAVAFTGVLALSACTGSGRFSAKAVCERLGGDYVGSTCQHHTTAEELAAQQWCETHGGVYVADDGCELGSGGP